MINTPNNAPDVRAVLLEEENSGRDEMNFAGNPIALLQAASKTGQNVIRREARRELENGRIVNSVWEVSGHPELGLPGPSEDLLILVLLQLTREAADPVTGIWPQTVHFSRYELMRRLKWSGNKKDYLLLRNCFARLQATKIQADYAFYDNRTKTLLDSVGFNIIDEFELASEPMGLKNHHNLTLPISNFKWSRRMHESFAAGNIRSLALDFTLSLDTPTSKKLFRLLEVFRHWKTPALPEVYFDLFDLQQRLGMISHKFPSKIKQVLKPAIEELISRGYLESVEYEKTAQSEQATFRFQKVSMDNLSILAAKGSGNGLKTPKNGIVESNSESKDVRADAMKCFEVFQTLSKDEQNELLKIARQGVVPAFWDRLESPESPMSLGLWKLVEEKYPERVAE